MAEPDKTSERQSLVPRAAALSPLSDAGLAHYLAQIQRFPLLDADEEYMLARRYAAHQDLPAAQRLITSHLRLVAKIAKGYRGYGLPLGEMISEGNIGLMQAVKKFDPERGFRLATYAMWWIRAAIQEYILRSWSLVKLGTTAAQKKLFFNLRRIKNRMRLLGDKSLSDDDAQRIAKELDVAPHEVQQMDGRLAGGDVSLNQPARGQEDRESGWQDFLPDSRPSQETALAEQDEAAQRHLLVEQALQSLTERERAILQARRLREPPLTLKTLSAQHNISRERVRQIEAQAFRKLSEKVRATAPVASSEA